MFLVQLNCHKKHSIFLRIKKDEGFKIDLIFTWSKMLFNETLLAISSNFSCFFMMFVLSILKEIIRNNNFEHTFYFNKIESIFAPLCDIFHHKASLLNQLKPRNENFKQWKQTPHIKLNIVVFTIFRCSSLIFAITWITYKFNFF